MSAWKTPESEEQDALDKQRNVCLVCSRCRVSKPAIDFYYSRNSKTRRCGHCKTCMRLARLENRRAKKFGIKFDTDNVRKLPCEPRRPQAICKLCAGLSHRVRGNKCSLCGRPFRPLTYVLGDT